MDDDDKDSLAFMGVLGGIMIILFALIFFVVLFVVVLGPGSKQKDGKSDIPTLIPVGLPDLKGSK